MTLQESLDMLAAERVQMAELEAKLHDLRANPPAWWRRRRTKREHAARVTAIATMIRESRERADALIDAIAGGARAMRLSLAKMSRARRERQAVEYERAWELLQKEVDTLNDARWLAVDEDGEEV